MEKINWYPLIFKPHFTHYIWGGQNLPELNKVSDQGEFSESWEVSCHPNGESIVSNGSLQGWKLSDLIKKYPSDVLGRNSKYKDNFPLLVKLINTKTAPSVQVHPDDQNAQALEGYPYGKSEMWYILGNEDQSSCYCGLKDGITKGMLKQDIESFQEHLEEFSVAPGDIFHIPAGTVHAPGEHIRFIEIQQNCDITYRLFDYNRIDDTGQKRELHVDKGLQVIDYGFKHEKKEGEILVSTDSCKRVLRIKSKYFCVEKVDVKGSIVEKTEHDFMILIFVSGSGQIEAGGVTQLISSLTSVFIPASLDSVSLKGEFSYIKCYLPSACIEEVNIKKVYTD